MGTNGATGASDTRPTTGTPQNGHGIENDIQKILLEVKLPAGKSSSASKGTKLTFDTQAVAVALSDTVIGKPQHDVRAVESLARVSSGAPPRVALSDGANDTIVKQVPELPKPTMPMPARATTVPMSPKAYTPRLPTEKTLAQSPPPTIPAPTLTATPVPTESSRVEPPMAAAQKPLVTKSEAPPPLPRDLPPTTRITPTLQTHPLPTKPTPIPTQSPTSPPAFPPTTLQARVKPTTSQVTAVPLPKVVTPPDRATLGGAPPSSLVEAKTGEALQKSNTLSSFRTLKEDLQGIVRNKKVSLVHAVALEEEKKHKRDKVLAADPIHSGRSQKKLLLAFLLTILGLFALFGVYIVTKSQSARSTPLPSAIIFSEQTTLFPLDKQPFGEVKRNLSALRSFTQLTLGAMTRVMPIVSVQVDGVTEDRPATLAEFFNALGIPAPNDLTRSLGKEFFFGIHVVDENVPVFVASVTSYERAFAAMLAWEKNINADLSPIFTPVSPFILDENGLLVQRPFEDLVIRNYDVRALRDDESTIQLYYSFPTRNILIVAESTYSFTEVLSRLRAERRL
ncbi:hypothetical protein A3A34_03265 [Candidatus Kaiserbacteria bacterium RIFCSPLOWO2_01_FULL_50_24]|uniref:Uncharacterized protein n=1 Tax=Candidatus Kaiserbacteria bacterium RIFCSPLOWO2_01_FULL_50_24 TaxID=1798507 RepID=A0A1F6ERI3_9BACT|nr:MAG: hypothetical protein A3A34_03265 [Candidatus Kaiserbacteria bacterium RIFCSPLOWO2_01_FULL_50_24]